MNLPKELEHDNIQLVDCRALDTFIKYHLGREWNSLHHTEGICNGSLQQEEVGPYWPEDKERDQAAVLNWIETGNERDVYTSMILSELYERGLLEEGSFYVLYDW